MAQRVIYTDDYDGTESPDVETRHFSLGTDHYSLDLSYENWQDLRDSLKKYTNISSRTALPLKKSSPAHDTTAIRQWAKDHGIPVKDRGKIPDDIIRHYEEDTSL